MFSIALVLLLLASIVVGETEERAVNVAVASGSKPLGPAGAAFEAKKQREAEAAIARQKYIEQYESEKKKHPGFPPVHVKQPYAVPKQAAAPAKTPTAAAVAPKTAPVAANKGPQIKLSTPVASKAAPKAAPKAVPKAAEQPISRANLRFPPHSPQPQFAHRYNKRSEPTAEGKEEEVDVSHCDGAADSQALHRYAAGDESRLPLPKMRIRGPHIDPLEFDVTLPDVANEFRYVLAFEPIERNPNTEAPLLESPSRCSSIFGTTYGSTLIGYLVRAYDTSDEDQHADPFEAWTFAPNANWPRAFKGDFETTRVSNESIWRISATDCAHLRYTARVTLDELAACPNAMASVKLHDGAAQALISTLRISAIKRRDSTPLYEHRYNVALYSDSQGNAALLFDSETNSDGLAETDMGNVLLRSIKSTENALSLQLQTASDHGALRLTSVTPRQVFDSAAGDLASPIPLHARTTDAPPYGGNEGRTLQNWEFDTESSAAAYNGQYALLFKNKAGDALLVELLVRIDDAPAATSDQLAKLHGSIAQHKPDDSAVHRGSFKHGERLCMQSFILLSRELAPHVEIELVEALLCPDDGTGVAKPSQPSLIETLAAAFPDESEETRKRGSGSAAAAATSSRAFKCSGHPHAVRLFADGEAKRSDVEIVWPGAYGASSVALCFNASATLLDDKKRSVVYGKQRYEALVKMHAHNAASKQASAAWHSSAATRHESALHTTPAHLEQRAKLVRSQFAKRSDGATADFASGDLERSFTVARGQNLLDEHEMQMLPIEIERSEALSHGVSDRDAVIVIGLVLAIVLMSLLCYAAFVYRNSLTSPLPLETQIQRQWLL